MIPAVSHRTPLPRLGPDTRPLAVALAVSVLFHLSMVSVFSIVIWFPRADIRYLSFDLVYPPAHDRVPIQRNFLRMSRPDQMMDRAEAAALEETEHNEWLASLPPVELPRFTFPKLEGLGGATTLRVRSPAIELAEEEERQDSWAVFTQDLRSIGQLFSGRNELPKAPADIDQTVAAAAPAPGFTARVRWMSEPKTRRLLFSIPMRALWNVDPAQVTDPVALVFTVDPLGKVTDVQMPVEDDAGIVTNVANALWKYRFEPLYQEQPKDQRGTFIVSPERATP
jgi:hypothetical protein